MPQVPNVARARLKAAWTRDRSLFEPALTHDLPAEIRRRCAANTQALQYGLQPYRAQFEHAKMQL